MKLSSLCMLLFCVNLSATSLAQEAKVSVEVTNGNIRQVIEAIKAQSDYTFVYNAEELDEIGNVSVRETNADVRDVLDACLKGTGFTYTLIDRVIVIKRAKSQPPATQEIKRITGRVTDKQGQPIPGVSVLLKGTSFGVATDIDGRFELAQPQDTTGELIFSFVGMKTQTVKWTQGKEVNVVMEAETETLDDVVITGYQKVDRRKSTASVTSKTMDELMIPGASSLDQMLMGQIPDMMVMSNSGEVGVVPKLRIRGTSTLIGNREPLWVVDGIVVQDPVEIAPEELNDPDYINRIGNAIAGLNPQDIERIDVLKDAAATALYGTKAANGVIVITTKKGHIGKPIITYNATVTMRQRPRYTDRNINVMNSAERIQFSRELEATHYEYDDDMTMVGYEGLMQKLYNGELTYAQFETEVRKLEELNTDWFDILTSDSFSHQHTLSITGGSEEGQYYASIGYTRDNDVIWDDNNERYTVVLNLDANLAPWLRASLGVNGNISSRKYYQEDLAPMDYAYKTSRAIPLYDKNGNYYYYQKKATTDNYTYYNYNILNELENSSHEQEGQSLTATANLQFDIRDWLNLDAIFSYSTSHTTRSMVSCRSLLKRFGTICMRSGILRAGIVNCLMVAS